MKSTIPKPQCLDKHWEIADISCPFCQRILWMDNHETSDANFYCECCGGMVIALGIPIRAKVSQ